MHYNNQMFLHVHGELWVKSYQVESMNIALPCSPHLSPFAQGIVNNWEHHRTASLWSELQNLLMDFISCHSSAWSCWKEESFGLRSRNGNLGLLQGYLYTCTCMILKGFDYTCIHNIFLQLSSGGGLNLQTSFMFLTVGMVPLLIGNQLVFMKPIEPYGTGKFKVGR